MATFEFESEAALLECDPESAHLRDLADGTLMTFGTMFAGVEWTKCIRAHTEAPIPPLSDKEEDRRIAKELNEWGAQMRREQPNPRAYRVKITVEYEPLSEEESARAIAAAVARDAARWKEDL